MQVRDSLPCALLPHVMQHLSKFGWRNLSAQGLQSNMETQHSLFNFLSLPPQNAYNDVDCRLWCRKECVRRVRCNKTLVLIAIPILWKTSEPFMLEDTILMSSFSSWLSLVFVLENLMGRKTGRFPSFRSLWFTVSSPRFAPLQLLMLSLATFDGCT